MRVQKPCVKKWGKDQYLDFSIFSHTPKKGNQKQIEKHRFSLVGALPFFPSLASEVAPESPQGSTQRNQPVRV